MSYNMGGGWEVTFVSLVTLHSAWSFSFQLQEAFGWDPFIQLFADYQVITKYPSDNAGKMNLWMKKFSEIVQKNLVPFFKAWGWPIQEEVTNSLASLPEWEENPMKEYVRDTSEHSSSE